MKLTSTFWVVTKPTPVSELGDILFSCTLHTLRLQFLGGLDPDNIHGVYTKEKEATEIAKWLLDLRDS